MKKIALFLLILLTIFAVDAQSKKGKNKSHTPDKDEMAAYRYQAERLVEYFAETLNFLGDSATIAKERQVVINESYLKIFKDEEVQVEDDLIEDRIVPVYKDVRAYLRDVGFFYKKVKFEYVVQNIEQFYNSRQEINIRVTVNRHLTGTTIKDEMVENNMIRYIEIDLDHAQEVLKIISIYSTRLEEKEDIELWWASLPDYWRHYFAKDITLENTLPLQQVLAFGDSSLLLPYSADLERLVLDSSIILLDSTLKPMKKPATDYFLDIVSLPDSIAKPNIWIKYLGASLHSIVGNMMKQISVDISNESVYSDLAPLSKMTYLKELNLSGTPIVDIMDLRNLSDLEKVNISNTHVTDLSPLQYLLNIKTIDISNTAITDISPLANNIALEEVKMNQTPVSDIFPLARLTELKRLWMNQSNVSDISALANNKNLEIISFHQTNVSNCSVLKNFPLLIMAGMNQTKVADVSPLNHLAALQNIFINQTPVADISSLTNLESLTRIYADQSKISKADAVQYMQEHPHTLVVFESETLQQWWKSMPDAWKKIWRETQKLSGNPTIDQLHELAIKKELNFNYRKINQIDCLSEMLMLESLSITGNEITSLEPLSKLTSLHTIDFSKTKVSDIQPLLQHRSLTTIRCNESPVRNLELLQSLSQLTLVECDQSGIEDEKVDPIVQTNPNCLVVYRTAKNKIWWDNLSDAWKKVFSDDENIETPDKYQLQTMMLKTCIDITDNRSITDLTCLQPLRYINKLIINNTGINTLDDIVSKTGIRYLDISNNPIASIDALSPLHQIDTLILENTPVKKLDVVGQFPKLQYINLSGTQIKNLKPLTLSTELRGIDFNNTAISNIAPLQELPHLQQIKAFRTKVSESKINDFKVKHADCEVIYY